MATRLEIIDDELTTNPDGRAYAGMTAEQKRDDGNITYLTLEIFITYK